MTLHRSEKGILIGAVIVGVGIGLFLALNRSSIPLDVAAEPLEMFTDEHGKQLQVDPSKVADERQVFLKEFAQRKGFVLRDVYERWIDRIGANGIISVVQEVHPTCHEEGHDLGKVIYARVQDIGASLATCDEACFSGCMHGVFMEAFAPGAGMENMGAHDMSKHINAKDVLPKVETACPEGSGYQVGDCIHGIGHAFMLLSKYDIPKALSFCDQLSPYYKAYYCATGAYMEYMNHLPKEDVDGKTVFEPCKGSPYPTACFRHLLVSTAPRYYARGKTFADLVAGCLAMKRSDELGCFHGIGNSHTALVVGGIMSFAEACGKGNKDDQRVCIEGMIERLARYHPDVAKNVCAPVSGWQKDVCDASVVHGLYDPEKPLNLYLR